MPHTFSVKQRDAMYESFHVNDSDCRAILHDMIEGGICAKRGCPRQVKYGFAHCCINCCNAPNDVVVTHDVGCVGKNENRESLLASQIGVYRQNKEIRNQRNADLDNAKRLKTEDYNRNAGTSSGSQWQQGSNSQDAELVMRTSHNKLVSNLV